MVTVVNSGTVGYFEEAAYAVRVAAAAGESRRFGMEFGSFNLMRERRKIIDRMVSSSNDPNSKSYGDVNVEFDLNYQLVDARELSYISESIPAAGGSSPNWLHLIDPVEPSGAFTLPSRTVHSELTGITKRVDVAGCLLKEQNITYAAIDPRGILIKDSFLGQRITTTENVVSNLFGQTSGATEDMEFSDGANAASVVLKATGQGGGSLPNSVGASVYRTPYQTDPQPFVIPKGDASQVVVGGTGDLAAGTVAGGTDLTTEFSGFGINIAHEFEEARPNRTGTNNYNKPIQPYLQGAFIKSRTFTVSLVLDPTADTTSFFEDPQLEKASNEIFIKIQKKDDSADWIAFMFTSSGTIYNPQEDYQANFGFIEDTQFHTLGWQPQKLRIVANNDNATLRSAS